MSAPAVAVDTRGNVCVAWKHVARGRPTISQSLLPRRSENPVVLTTHANAHQDHPAITTDSSFIAWEETLNGVRTIQVSLYAVSLNDPLDGEAAFPTIAFDRRRNRLIVVWEARQGDRFRVFCRTVHLLG